MSWSIAFIGKPQKVAEALEAESAKMSDQSKIEYDTALPHLVGLVKNNFVDEAKYGSKEPMLKINASGHGNVQNGEQIQRQVSVSIENIYNVLV